MNWLDIVLLVLILGVGGVGASRGFGRAALDALGLYAALWAASALAPALAAHVGFAAGGAGVNRSWAFGLLFAVLGALALATAWYVHGLLQVSAGVFDKLFGLVSGVGAGVILAHALAWALVTADPRHEAGAVLVGQGMISDEVYSFPAYHVALDTITGAGTYRRSLPDVAGSKTAQNSR
jgi:uncharacterized membrane protein required for colicin V production